MLIALVCQVLHSGSVQKPVVDRTSLLSGSFSSGRRAPSTLNALSWNIERGRNLDGILEFISRVQPDLCILQEVDVNAQRTGKTNIAEHIARKSGMDYVWGCEFQELGQGGKNAPAFQGQAIVTRFPIRSAKILRFTRQSSFWAPRWYMPNWPILQRRAGGRIALVAEIEARNSIVSVYNVHLESRDGELLREQQLGEILADIERIPAGRPVIVAGDFNTKHRPSSLTARLTKAGFRDAVNQPDAPTSIKGTTIDWIFVRGNLSVECPAVHDGVRASDHFPVTIRLSLTDQHKP